MDQFGSQMRSFSNNGDNTPQRPQSQPQQSSGTAKSTGGAPSKPHNGCADVKPRLTKEQHDILEAHFQQQHKPSTSTKKGFAETLGVPVDKINVSHLRPWGIVLVANKTRRIGFRTAEQR
jgi:hypothetical protein